MSRADALALPAIVPPTPRGESDPVGLLDGFIIVGALVLTFWFAVRLVTWLNVKLGSWKLFLDINREVGIGGPASRRAESDSWQQEPTIPIGRDQDKPRIDLSDSRSGRSTSRIATVFEEPKLDVELDSEGRLGPGVFICKPHRSLL